VEQIHHQLKRPGIRGIQGCHLGREPRDQGQSLGCLSQGVEFRHSQPGLHVAEGVLAGDEINEPVPGIAIQQLDFLGCDRGLIREKFGIALEGKGIAFHIKLNHVDFEISQQINQLIQTFQGRDFAAADVDQDATSDQVRMVFNRQDRQGARLNCQELAQADQAIEESRPGRGLERDPPV